MLPPSTKLVGDDSRPNCPTNRRITSHLRPSTSSAVPSAFFRAGRFCRSNEHDCNAAETAMYEPKTMDSPARCYRTPN